jgi:hypothetical protein
MKIETKSIFTFSKANLSLCDTPVGWSARCETPAGVAGQGRPRRRKSDEEAPEAAIDKRTPETETNRDFNVNILYLAQPYF